MELSNYIRTYSIKPDSIVLFNTINKSIVELEKSFFINDTNKLIDELPSDIFNTLSEMGYFISDSEATKLINSYLTKDDNKLIISVETTLGCNLNCPYCYQGSDKQYRQLSNDDIQYLLDYLELVYKKSKYKELVLKILGGEPTTIFGKTEKIINEAYSFCSKNGITCSLMIDTNGLLIDNILALSNYDSLLLTIPLSYKRCHDTMRKKANGEGTYQTIVNNIKRLHKEKPEITVVLRHNTDIENIGYFEDYVCDLKKQFDFIPIIDINYTTELGDNDYINPLSYNHYKSWKVNQATDILVKYGFYVMTSPLVSMDKCQHRSKYSLKIFSDGTIGKCAMWFFNKNRHHISEVLKNLNIIEEFDQQSENKTIKCLNCYSFFVCNASYTLPCIKSLKEKECEIDGNFNVNLEEFIRKYLEYNDKGLGHLFVGFTKGIPIR